VVLLSLPLFLTTLDEMALCESCTGKEMQIPFNAAITNEGCSNLVQKAVSALTTLSLSTLPLGPLGSLDAWNKYPAGRSE
jgi:hypothetical protein